METRTFGEKEGKEQKVGQKSEEMRREKRRGDKRR